MKRRDVLKIAVGGAASLALSPGHSAVARPQTIYPPTTAVIRVLAAVHALQPETRYAYGRHMLWVDLYTPSNTYTICDTMDPIYQHPIANWTGYTAHAVPDDLRSPKFPWDPPRLPDIWSWPELVATTPPYGFMTEGMPRYVKVPRCRPILDPFTDKGRPRDRRDDLEVIWEDVDLGTGEAQECSIDDPIYDSVLRDARVPGYDKWERLEALPEDDLQALLSVISAD